MISIERPIFIVGAGRSGSTVFHHMFCGHPGVAWLPGTLLNRFPERVDLARTAMRALDYPVVGAVLGRRIRPGECYPFWERLSRGFSAPCRDLTAEDVTEGARRRIRSAAARVLTRRRNRFLAKITGWPRIGFLSEIFGDALFIHVVRDGRAVVNSLLEVDFWRGWGGPENWMWGELSLDQREEWERSGRSFVVLAAIQWKILMDAMERASTTLGEERFMEIRYEDLCADTLGTMKRVVGFCGLPWERSFEHAVSAYRLKDNNDKYRENLTSRQRADLEAALGGYLERYGYPLERSGARL
ncbi:hypothetical protein Rxycam_00894 [Rubrobacter xylanophilus DSM 9941]|uniref:sulfotransferase family protein n=1 Tax=Rubrobacter xylanophilus TaxID=49319 RepID=UPI001C6404BB|nr:sulfotransferase [Rubrobacter xylanophilus]QYJ15082.1 hypothetical protein Rxycam_00894 [Rubrobacter xylanophilus DSM 9941]